MAAERLGARVPGRERVLWSGVGEGGVDGEVVVGGGDGAADAATASADDGGGEEVASARMAAICKLGHSDGGALHIWCSSLESYTLPAFPCAPTAGACDRSSSRGVLL